MIDHNKLYDDNYFYHVNAIPVQTLDSNYTQNVRCHETYYLSNN